MARKFFIATSVLGFATAKIYGIGEFYSIEAGQADGLRHFDHHDQLHRANPAPCADTRIPVVGEDEIIVITHMDADTYIGILRLVGQPLPEVDFALMERVDLNGSSVVEDLFDPTLLYMVGIGQLARDLKFPRPSTDGPVEVSELVEAMMAKTSEEITALGRETQEKAEAAYRDCAVERTGAVGLWVVGPTDALDPSRPYQDGVEVVVVFRRHYQSISVYCSPDAKHAFGGQELAGIQFAGHPKAAGSPRGVAFAEADASRVFAAVCEVVNS